jgi:hypothetical protein
VSSSSTTIDELRAELADIRKEHAALKDKYITLLESIVKSNAP